MSLQPAPLDPKKIIPALTGLRWVAAFCVWFHHFPPPVSLPDWLSAWFSELHIGVDIFFVLSGFLITYRYMGDARASRGWLIAYTRNRIARIYPVYFLVTLIAFFVLPLSLGQDDPVDYYLLFLNLSFLRAFSLEFIFSGVPQGWTLTVEECFYFFAPLMFLLWRRFRLHTGWILLGVYAAGLVLWQIGEVIQFQGFFQGFRFMVAFTFFGKALSFLIGAELARRMLRQSIPKWLAGLENCTWIAIAGIAGVVFLISLGQNAERPSGVLHPALRAVDIFLLVPFIALLIYGLVTENTIVARSLATRPLVLLGRASYSFYLIHLGFFSIHLNKFFHDRLAHPLAYLCVLGCLILLSIAVYYCFEEPMRRLIRPKRGGVARRQPPCP